MRSDKSRSRWSRRRTKARRLQRALKGQYEGGGFIVDARHAWSRKDRKAARTAAQILEYQAEYIREHTREAARDLLIYGYTGPGSWKTDIPAVAKRQHPSWCGISGHGCTCGANPNGARG